MTERKKTELAVTGMTCANCASTIEKALMGIDGVSGAAVNLAGETARVEYDPDKTTVASLENAVRDAGYDVATEKVTLKVGGMTCAMCVKTIEEVLGELDGVSSATVNLGAEKAYVTYNPRAVSVADMKRTITETGYTFIGVEGDVSDDAEKKIRAQDLAAKRNRIIVGLAVGIPLMLLMLLSVQLPVPLPYVMFIIATPTFVYLSHPIFRAGYRALRNRNLTMDVMYSMGIGVAYVSSVLGTFEIVLTPDFLFYETAVLLATFLMIGKYLETRAKGQTSDAIKKLIQLRPKTATVINDGTEKIVQVDEVVADDVVVVKPGEQMPVDGVVTEGESAVDESMITGESIPAAKHAGDLVYAGTLNTNGVLRFRATNVGRETVLARIIRLVEEAQASKPPVQKIADTAVTYFIPAVIGIAILTFIGWYLIAGETLLFALTALIAILVIACPCALGLATPTAITVGLGRGAELGVLIKNSDALERSEKITHVMFDKTGTLTKGAPVVTDIIALNGTEDAVLAAAASVETNSQHPLAAAVVAAARERDIALHTVEHFTTIGGMGVSAQNGETTTVIGNRALLDGRGIAYAAAEAHLDALERDGKTTMLIAENGTVSGIIAIADTVKENAARAIAELKKMGVAVTMITGDTERTAAAIARQLSIDSVLAGVLPQDKSAEVKKAQERGEVVAFVGDGINDAPALAQADVGIALGSGTDVAIESGEVVLIKDDVLDVVAALQLNRKVMTRIKQNLFWAFAYNTALIPVAAGALYPLFGITFRPELAGLAMALSSVTVISLSLLLRTYVPPVKKQEVYHNGSRSDM